TSATGTASRATSSSLSGAPSEPSRSQGSVSMTMNSSMTLSPCQQRACDRLEALLNASPVVGFIAETGTGRSTIAKAIADKRDGLYLGPRDIAAAMTLRPADQWEEALGELVVRSFATADLVVIDDLGSFMPLHAARERFAAEVLTRYVNERTAALGKRLL